MNSMTLSMHGRFQSVVDFHFFISVAEQGSWISSSTRAVTFPSDVYLSRLRYSGRDSALAPSGAAALKQKIDGLPLRLGCEADATHLQTARTFGA